MKGMRQIKDTLTETRDWALEMKDSTRQCPLLHIQFACQAWNLDKMIKIANTVERAYNRLRGKQR